MALDNLSVHKHSATRQAIEAEGCCLRFLPPYSPDSNPIESAFSKLKTSLRGAAARTYDDLVIAIGARLSGITPDDSHAFFRHCGYTMVADNECRPLRKLL